MSRATPHGCNSRCFDLKKQHLNLLQHFDLHCAGHVCCFQQTQHSKPRRPSVQSSLVTDSTSQHLMPLQCTTTSDFWCKIRSQEGSDCHACCSLQGEWKHSQGARFASKNGRARSSKACHSKEGAVLPHAMTTACLLS